MKILSDNNIESVIGRDLGFYLGDNSHHKAINALNDIPSVQWVAGYPADIDNSLVFNSSSGRFELSTYYYVEGITSMSCIYFGKFQVDRMIWSARYNYDEVNDTSINPDYPYDNFVEEIEVPIRVYSSLKDFVTGRFQFYADYFKTLTELEYSTPYILADHSIRVKLISEYDMLRHSINKEVGWSTNSYSSFVDEGVTYYLITGNLIDIRTNEKLSVNDNEYTINLDVGTWFLVKKTSDQTDTANYYNPDVLQLVSIRGDGSSNNDITMLTSKHPDDLVLQDINTDLSNVCEIQQILAGTRIGLIRSGNFEDFPNAQVGLSRTFKDYSVKTELVNGGHQFINRNSAKVFSGSMVLDRDQVNRLTRFALSQRAKPFPVDVLTGMELESPKTIFGVFEQLPDERFSYRTGEVRDVSFSIKQIF